MSISKYTTLLKVAELGSITKAAESLNYSQPNVSYVINSFEKEIGFPVFIRNKDNITVTENGKEVLAHCRSILKKENDLQQTISSINGLSRGAITIKAMMSMMHKFVPQIVCEFTAVYPHIDIMLEESLCPVTVPALQNGSVDIGFFMEQDHMNYDFFPLLRDPGLFFLHKNHPLASYDRLPLDMLQSCSIITYADPCRECAQKNFYKTNSLETHIKIRTDSDVPAFYLVSQNMGVFYASSLCAHLAPPNVVTRPASEDISRVLGIGVKSIKNSSPAVREFVKIAQRVAAEHEFHI